MATRTYTMQRIDAQMRFPQTFSVTLPDGAETEASAIVSEFAAFVDMALCHLDVRVVVKQEMTLSPAEAARKAISDLYFIASLHGDYEEASRNYETALAYMRSQS